jgi:transposase
MEAGGGAVIARALRNLGYHVEIFETRQLSKFLRLRRNKTDPDDARGIAEASRLGRHTLSQVHLKSLDSQAIQSRLVLRRHIIRDRIAAVNLLSRQLELYGGRIGRREANACLSTRAQAEIIRLFGRHASPLKDDFQLLLKNCEQLLAQQKHYDEMLKVTAFENETCRLLMEVPGVGPVCALTFYAAVDDPNRFARAHDIGSYFGLAPKLHESGTTSRRPRISKMGNRAVRSLLVRAAIIFMRSRDRDPALYRWALGVEERAGKLRARVALARKLAIILLTMWRRNEHYRRKGDAC